MMAVAAFFGIMALRMHGVPAMGIAAALAWSRWCWPQHCCSAGWFSCTRAKTGDAHYKRMEALNQQAPMRW